MVKWAEHSNLYSTSMFDMACVLSFNLILVTCPDSIITRHGGMHFGRPSVCPSVTFRVHAITYICIDGLPSYLVQMLSWSRRCAVTLTRIHTSKVKVSRDIKRSEYTCSCPRYNLLMHWWITILLVQMLSSLRRCAYIQEYLDYWSNNLFFLFSHSWPVVV